LLRIPGVRKNRQAIKVELGKSIDGLEDETLAVWPGAKALFLCFLCVRRDVGSISFSMSIETIDRERG